jgi:pimeloyl-ACP methyl ester carboxylesterase
MFRKLISLSLFLLANSLSVHAQDITGSWMGTISFMGKNLRVIFHFKEDENKDITATMDSPDQGVMGVPVKDVMLLDDDLLIDMPKFKAQYSGKYKKDSLCFVGALEQGSFRLPLKLKKRLTDEPLFNRPQTPKPPFPYLTEEVKIENRKGNLTLAGTLTKPNGNGKYAAVILITGSGPEDRDETIFEHKPFFILSDELTKKGFAVLRCDDRGTAKSTGVYENSTVDDFATDVDAQIDFLKTRKDIDTKKIGLLGHSEGGVIGPLVASRRKDIAFIVMLAGPGIDFFDLLLAQDSLTLKAEGAPREKINESIRMNKELYRILKTEKDSLSSAEEMKKVIADDFDYKDEIVVSTIETLNSRWMRWYISYNPSATLQKIKCPVLAINGDKDVQVPAKTNLDAIEKALMEGGNKKFEVKILHGLNHLFQLCKTGAFSEYSTIEETMSPIVMNTIDEWMEKNILRK